MYLAVCDDKKEALSSAGLCTFQGKNLPVSRLSCSQIQEDDMALLFKQRETMEL